MGVHEILDYKIFEIGNFSLSGFKLLLLIIIFISVKTLLWSIKKTMDRAARFKQLDHGSKLALLQITRYVVWLLSIVLILEMLGIQVTFLIAGSAALLIGLGLGLQQTFNDIISGIILLIEGSTKVGDVLEVESDVVRVVKIGLRASKVKSREDVIIMIPNSYLVTNKVVNWSHQIEENRFNIQVGVAYGSDVDLVIRLLEESAKENPVCSKITMPEGRFLDFGDSAFLPCCSSVMTFSTSNAPKVISDEALIRSFERMELQSLFHKEIYTFDPAWILNKKSVYKEKCN